LSKLPQRCLNNLSYNMVNANCCNVLAARARQALMVCSAVAAMQQQPAGTSILAASTR
jgi:hypothetical protein